MNTENHWDIIESFNGATIQHGPMNRRVYVMNLGGTEPRSLIDRLEDLCRSNRYTKMFIKVPAGERRWFDESGFHQEARVPKYYNHRMDAVFMSRFLDSRRCNEPDRELIERNLALAMDKQGDPARKELNPDTRIRRCGPGEAEAMTEIYRIVFPTYPFPIHDPGYIRRTMETHIKYWCVESGQKMVALSSAEMDEPNQAVEMTDFATLPAYRGNGYALHLLLEMENAMRARGLKTAYTIARAMSPGMNITFSKLSYGYGGRLVNNTNISGQIESMNIWYKSL